MRKERLSIATRALGWSVTWRSRIGFRQQEYSARLPMLLAIEISPRHCRRRQTGAPRRRGTIGIPSSPSGSELAAGGVSVNINVQAFLILERVARSKEFVVSVLLQADGQFIGKSSIGIVAEGQEIMLSLRWDQPRQRFVASSQAAGGVPILSFIPFAPPGADDAVPPEFSMAKRFVLNSDVIDPTEAHENQN